MRQMIEYSKMAFRNIWGNKTRSALTMLGIIIGISSVIMVLCVGGGGKKQFEEQFSAFSSGSVYLYVGGDGTTMGDYFTTADVEAVKSLDSIATVTMAGGSSGTVRGSKKEIQANISSGTGDMFSVFPTTILKGRKWDEGDNEASRRVITIDDVAAKAIFGTDDIVGLTVQLTAGDRTSDFTVVGVSKGSSQYSYNREPTATITMPQNTLIAMNDVYG
ncbi:MAG: ABC transporter permease, partial [Pygmaiobacter sp.]